MSDDGVIESHVPLLDPKMVKRLDKLSNGLNLHTPEGQGAFLTNLEQRQLHVGVDQVLEYLVNNHDVLLGDVTPLIRLSPDCNPARRIHLGVEQNKRHKTRGGQPVGVQVSEEMVGAHA